MGCVEIPVKIKPELVNAKGDCLALEFLLALGQAVPDNPEGFEWKKLGGAAYLEIGGSKRFDHLKDDLCTLAEIVTGLPVEELGLVSKGSLYSIYLGFFYCRAKKQVHSFIMNYPIFWA